MRRPGSPEVVVTWLLVWLGVSLILGPVVGWWLGRIAKHYPKVQR